MRGLGRDLTIASSYGLGHGSKCVGLGSWGRDTSVHIPETETMAPATKFKMAALLSPASQEYRSMTRIDWLLAHRLGLFSLCKGPGYDRYETSWK